jgi:hypothetical protein
MKEKKIVDNFKIKKFISDTELPNRSLLHMEAYRIVITELEYFRIFCQMEMTPCSIYSITI